MSYKATKPGLVLFYILACFNCIVSYLGPFCCHYLPNDWLEIPLSGSLTVHGEGIISKKPRPNRAYDCVGLLYSFVVLLHDIYVLPWPYVIHFLLLYSLLVLKVP